MKNPVRVHLKTMTRYYLFYPKKHPTHIKMWFPTALPAHTFVSDKKGRTKTGLS
jgi:hypothetical protein